MRIKHLFFILTAICTLLLPGLVRAQQEEPQVVNIPDPNLAARIRSTLGVSTITTHNLLKLTTLSAPGIEIEDLTGLEYAQNLRFLSLANNNISDISPLTELTQMDYLHLDFNNLSDISPLVGLKNLRQLVLNDNAISDISPLAELTKLERLFLDYNTISDVSALAELTKLTNLGLYNNTISDISPLAELKNLRVLSLGGNNISDISPLAGLTELILSWDILIYAKNLSDLLPFAGRLEELNFNHRNITDLSLLVEFKNLKRLTLSNNNISDLSPLTELTQLTFLNLQGNPLSYASINTHIPAMQASGIDVVFRKRVPKTLLKIWGEAQQGGVNSALPFPFIVDVLDQSGRRFAGVPVTFTITAGEGELSATTVETDINGRASVLMRMGTALGTTTVRVTAPNISELIEFTATAIPHTEPVIVSDTNLRASIMETLGKPTSEVLTHTDMQQLRTLTADNMDIYDLTGLEYATNLTSLSLQNNKIANVLSLTPVRQLTTLDLRNNWISDVAPLRSLTHLKDGQGLFLQGNRLNSIAIRTYIPLLQASGVNVRFDSAVTESAYIVRPIYPRGPGLRHDPKMTLRIKNLIREVQQFYADQMEIYGLGRKTFQFETDADGSAFVYHINGRFFKENAVPQFSQFDSSKNIIRLVFVEDLNPNTVSYPCGRGSAHNNHSGYAEVVCLSFIVVAHELGHAFGLAHDWRGGVSAGYIMSYGSQRMLSQCAAEWLDVHRYFNTERTVPDGDVTIEVLPPLPHPPNAIRLRFNVTAPAGLHQAQIFGVDPSGTFSDRREPGLIACKLLNGNPSETVEFVIPPLSPETFRVSLTVIDKHGNTGGASSGTVDVPSLLPEQPVSIPDPNLAAAIRKEIGETITTRTLFNLIELSTASSEITDITGIEYASNLRSLGLSGSISDISSLSDLTQLRALYIPNNNISDISPLAELKNLRVLSLGGNNISDITPLAELKELDFLWLNGNNISDISPLAAPTQIRWLDLGNNNISDVSPLVKLASVIPYRNGLRIYLRRNNISDISPFLVLDPRAAGRLWLLLSENPLNDLSRNRHIPALEAKGVRFGFSPYIQANSEITGPWLWMIAPTDRERGGAQSIDVDSLAAASKGTVTEADVAIHRANAGDRLGNFVWTPGRISALQNNNINDCLNRIGMIEGNVNDHSAYALFSWVSDTDRTRGRMYVGYDDAIKIWLNGEVVYRTAVNRHLYNFGRSFQVNLKRGQNLLLVKVNQREADWSMFVGIDGFEDMRVPDIAADVNRDGIVNVQDLVLVSSQLGQTGRTEADVNGDGAVNIQDLVLVAGALGDAAAAPSAFRATATALPARATVEQWLADAYRPPRLDARLERGVAWLERLLAALVPAETALLTNYPNPFNPETWIPYELAEPAEVMLRIYAVDGTLVRRLVLGHRAAGIYRSKSRAAYWDGRNAQGEKVASGLYFYTFSAGDFEATRKMLIRK